MRRLDALLAEAKRLYTSETVTLMYEDGTKKTMTPFEAVVAIFDDQESAPRIIATDQPPGSLIWALFSGEIEMQAGAEDWPVVD